MFVGVANFQAELDGILLSYSQETYYCLPLGVVTLL
jgi:hypothetical protein